MLTLRHLCFTLLLLAATPVSAQQTAPSPCSAPVDPNQAKLDEAGVASALQGGLPLHVVGQCAGFSVVVQDGIDDAISKEYVRHAERAYTRLAQESGETLSPRAVLFVFVNQEGMAKAERVVGGRAADVRDPRAGYAWLNTIWIDNEQHDSAGLRAIAVSHEFSHLFTAAATHGRDIPTWFNEGLATTSEVSLPSNVYPVPTEMRAAEYRGYVLDAVADGYPHALFELSDITDNRDWQAHFTDFDDMDLQYGQAFEFVRYSIGDRGRGSAWAVLHRVGAGADFDSAYQAVYGSHVDDAFGAAQAAWAADAARDPDALKLTVQIGGSSDVQVRVTAAAGLLETQAVGSAGAGSTVVLEIGSDGSLTQTAGGLALSSDQVPEDEEEYGAYVSVSIRRGDQTMERVSFDRTYGRWSPSTGRSIWHLGDEDRRIEHIDGPLSDPFPSGDAVVAEYAR